MSSAEGGRTLSRKNKQPTAAVIEAEAKAITARGSGYRGIISAGAEPISKATQAYFAAEASKEVARQYAEAQKEVARQQTHQAAVRTNPAILHELDAPFFQMQGVGGTAKRPTSWAFQVSVMNAFALGAVLEDALADMDQIEAGKAASNFGTRFTLNRIPLQDMSGMSALVAGLPSTGSGLGSVEVHAMNILKARKELAAIQVFKNPLYFPFGVGDKIYYTLKDQIKQKYGVSEE
jgi:hypothetical protein